MNEKLSFIVSGKVQGVCFRAYTEAAAREHDVTGWVRNRSDGRVEGEAYGAPEALEQFVKWLHKGSPHGRVEDVQVIRHGPEDDRPADFRTRG